MRALVGGFALLVAVGIAAFVQTFFWDEKVQRVEHTHKVIDALTRVELNSLQATNSARRFAAGADPAMLARSRESITNAQSDVSELQSLTADNQVQRKRLPTLRDFITEQAFLLPGNGTPAEMREALRRLDSQRVGARIRESLEQMRDEENRLLTERTIAQQRSAAISRALFAVAGFFATALVLLAAWRMRDELGMRSAAERALAARDEQYRQVVEMAGDIIYRTDKEGRFSFCNQASLAMLHYTESEVIGRSYLKLIRQDRRRAAERFYLRQFLRNQKSTYYEFPIIDGHGRERWVGQNVQLILEDGKPAGFQAIAREITERKQAEIELERSRAFVERIASTTPGILYVYDLEEHRNVFSNREVTTLLGYKPEEMEKSRRFTEQLIHPDDQPMIRTHYESMRRAHDGEIRRLEYRARHADGHWIVLSGRETPFERGSDGMVRRIVGISQDITERRAAQEKLTWQANYDALTGLANRHHFHTRLQGALRRAGIAQSTVALCLFDIDHFKAINDRFGHAAGDEVLEEVGNIVRAELRSNDFSGRLGGDEFCFALPGTDDDEAARVAERIRVRLSTLAFGMDTDAPFTVTATFGVAEAGGNVDARELLEMADRALYRAKFAGRNRVCVDV